MNLCIEEKEDRRSSQISVSELNTLINNEVLQFDENEFFASCIFYNENFNYKQIMKIADYYKIKKNRKKEIVINDIVLFELNNENHEIVTTRKLHDYYIECLLNDDYYKKFIINY
jgi:hypothetical protein